MIGTLHLCKKKTRKFTKRLITLVMGLKAILPFSPFSKIFVKWAHDFHNNLLHLQINHHWDNKCDVLKRSKR